MLPDEQEANRRYFYELASAKFGYDEAVLERVQAFHFKCGQGAKTGTGGHLPGNKNTGRISEVRGIPEGEPAVSPPTFEDLHTTEDFRNFGDRVRELTRGIPIGFKLSAQHIERDAEHSRQLLEGWPTWATVTCQDSRYLSLTHSAGFREVRLR